MSLFLPGDLMFVNEGGHVGMYFGNGRVIHVPYPGGVIMVSGIDRWPSIYAIGYPIADGPAARNKDERMED